MSMAARLSLGRLWCAGLLALSLACWIVPDVLAAWSALGAGKGAAAAQVMPAAGAPAVTLTGSSASVSWPAVTLTGGATVGGYVIKRYDTNGVAQPIGSGCSGVVTATRCTELNVPNGTWTYTDTPVLANWTGQESPASGPIDVGQTGGAASSTPGSESTSNGGTGSPRGVGQPGRNSGVWWAPSPIAPPLRPGTSVP